MVQACSIVQRTIILDIHCALHHKDMPEYDTAQYLRGAERPHLSEIPDEPAVRGRSEVRQRQF